MNRTKKSLIKSYRQSPLIYRLNLCRLPLFPSYHFPDWKSDSTNAGYFKTEKKSTLPALNTVPLYSLLPIPALYLHKHRYLKPFGTWIAIVATPLFQVVVWCFSLVLVAKSREFCMISTYCSDF